MKIASGTRKQYLISGTFLVLIALAIYGIVPQLKGFDQTWQSLRGASWMLVILAVMSSLASVACSAAVYVLLSPRRLRFIDTLFVQSAGLFVNRALPAGIGGLGLNFMYLQAHRLPKTQATAIVALNNFLGFVGHALLAVIILSIYLVSGSAIRVTMPHGHSLIIGAVVVLAVIGLVILTLSYRTAWQYTVRTQLAVLAKQYAKQPRCFMAALVMSCGLTLCNVTSLWLCCQALDLSVSFMAVFLVFTFGVVATTATPTPGGLGGVEAALAAGLVSQNVSWSIAVGVALLYRLASYWIGLPIGLIALGIVQWRHLLVRK